LVKNKIKSEHQLTASAIGYLGVSGTPGANQSFKQTGIVAVCFLRVQSAAAKLKR